MRLPVTLDEIAARYNVSVERTREALLELGVPIIYFLGHSCVYAGDVWRAHQRIEGVERRTARLAHVQRVLRELDNMGCVVEPLKMDSSYQSDCYEIRRFASARKKIGVKVQVVSYVQRGGGVHFNVGKAVLRSEQIDRVIMVASSFTPPTDFSVDRRVLFRWAKDRGYLGDDQDDDKPSFPMRVTRRTNPPEVCVGLDAVLAALD